MVWSYFNNLEQGQPVLTNFKLEHAKQKEFGFILDYRGVLGELDNALTTYSALAGFEESDLAGTLTKLSIFNLYSAQAID